MARNFWDDMPFLIQRDNVVRYDGGTVYILDRRIYPFEVKYVECRTFEDTAKAIEDMVTQSGGPGFAAGYGMVQAARQGDLNTLALAKERLLHTRPTNNHIRLVIHHMFKEGTIALEKGMDLEDTLLIAMEGLWQERHERGLAIGRAAAGCIRDGEAILNHCWAETGIIYSLKAALEEGKQVKAYCCETRPYLQGARLTADAIADLGISTTIITDAMPAHLMARGRISLFLTGADRVTMDGHVINKVGTLAIALSAHHFAIPYFPFVGSPDPQAPSPDAVTIEERDSEEVLHCLGQRTATHKGKGYYPAFDVTPPHLVSGIITPKGIYSPHALQEYFKV